jgi:PilZ domain-containing protein
MAALNTMNAAQPRYMEHRWGERVPLDLPVRLELAGELLAHGRLRNASISGALVVTESRFPLLATVEVVLHTPRAPSGRLALPACVVRREDGALGLEWRDMACESVVALLRAADARAPLWRKDQVFG